MTKDNITEKESIKARNPLLRVGAVMPSLRFFSRNFNRSKVFLIFFLCGGLKIFALKINTLQIKLQISEKYL